MKFDKEIDLVALKWYVEHLQEGDNITVTADLLNVLEQCYARYQTRTATSL